MNFSVILSSPLRILGLLRLDGRFFWPYFYTKILKEVVYEKYKAIQSKFPGDRLFTANLVPNSASA